MKKRIYILSGLLVIIAIIVFLILSKKKSDYFFSEFFDADSAQIVKELRYEYGIAIDSFTIQHETIKRNQLLATILYSYNVPAQKVNAVSMQTDIINPRKIKSGSPYCVFLAKDSLNTLMYLVYEETPIDFIVIDFTDSVRITRDHKEVIHKKKSFTSEIKGSLWQVITDNDQNPHLALELSEIYAWTVDFFRIQAGDSLSVIYQEDYIDSVSIGISKIYAAYFKHMDEEIYAIPFTQDSIESYFDADGKSLRRAFLKAPLRFSRISSRFSHSRYHPVLHTYRPHHGIDYAAPVGTPVHTVADGIVAKIGVSGGAGRMITIRHNGIYSTSYLHLNGYAKGMRVGKKVRQGDIIAYVGSSGLSTGPHLDFRFYKNGAPINAAKFKSPPVEPVKSENIDAFNSVKKQVLKDLSLVR